MITGTALGTILIVFAGIVAYFFVFHRANPPLIKNTVKIGNAAFEVEIASTTTEQTRGLSFRDGLSEGAGMLFLFNRPSVQSFWMKDMKFSIDIIWIGGGKVLGFVENAAPQPVWGLKIYYSPDGTDKVLEVNAGTVARDGIKVGDAVQIDI